METLDFKRLAIQAGDIILDLGCGEGRHAIAAQAYFPDATVIGIDLNANDLATARARSRDFFGEQTQPYFVQGDIYRLPIPDKHIDHIICSEVLEHLHDYPRALQEMKRMLKTGGSLNISVPRAWPEKICWWLSREYHEVEGGHVRIFRAQHLRNAICQQRFRFKGRHWAHALHSPYWWLRCARWNQGEQNRIAALYHRLLVWDLLKRPRITRYLEQLLNPVLGKSVVMYFDKQDAQ